MKLMLWCLYSFAQGVLLIYTFPVQALPIVPVRPAAYCIYLFFLVCQTALRLPLVMPTQPSLGGNLDSAYQRAGREERIRWLLTR